MARQIENSTPYSDKLVKLIPTEIIAAYLAIDGMLSVMPDIYTRVMIIASIVLLILVPFYLKILFEVKSVAQLIVTMISFGVWVFSIGGPFKALIWYLPVYGSVALILWTLVVPLFNYELDHNQPAPQ